MDGLTAIKPLRDGTPLEDHLDEAGLLVKREDLSCGPPGPPFSKMRGVISHMRKRVEAGVKLFGALDTSHSQAGHAVAYSARLLGVDSINFFPLYTKEGRPFCDVREEDTPAHLFGGRSYKLRPPQLRSVELGASLVGLQAGRSAVLFHQARKRTEELGGYMMPNALKLPETVEETAAEVVRTFERASREKYLLLRSVPWLVSASSATIAAGVYSGLAEVLRDGLAPQDGSPRMIIHMGYSRTRHAVWRYLADRLGLTNWSQLDMVEHVDEGYEYKDQARDGPTPPFPCNPYYDLKALRWWLREGRERYGRAVLWNIG